VILKASYARRLSSFADRHRVVSSSLVLVILCLIGVSAAYVLDSATTPRTALVATSTTLQNCGRGVPAEKCNPILGPPVTTQAPPAQPISTPGAFWPSPSRVPCGSSFFSSTTATTLSNQFGTIDCFRFSGEPTWILVGDGMSADGAGSAPGGAIVATDTCASGDGVCLDANSQHEFSSFSVSYPPLSTSYPARLEATFGGRILYISDANCGVFSFDVQASKWYGHTASDITAIMSQTSPPTSISAPEATPGSEAIRNHAPAATSACS
jgi:hypothetical protein